MDSSINIIAGQGKGHFFELEDNKTHTIGRDAENDIVIKDRFISRFHLEIRKEVEKLFIKDLNSKNGSFINGMDIDPGVEVEIDIKCPIVIGTTIFSIGDVSQTWLNPFLNSINIWYETNIIGMPLSSEIPKILKRMLKYIYEFRKALAESKDMDEIVESTLDTVSTLMVNADRTSITLFDDKTGDVSDVKYRSKSPVDDPKGVYNPQLVERALMLKKTVYISNAYAENYGEGDEVVDTLRFMKVKSAICVPIAGGSKTKGAIYIDSLDESHGFDKSDISLLEDISNYAALTINEMISGISTG